MWRNMTKSEPYLHLGAYITCSVSVFLLVLNLNVVVPEKTLVKNPGSIEFAEETSKFLADGLIFRHLAGCSIILASSTENFETNGNVSSFNALPLLKQIHANLFPIITLSNLSWRMKGNSFLRFTSACKCVVTVLSKVTPEFPLSFKRFVIGNEKLVRKDEDYYVFIAPSEDKSNSLLKSQIAFIVRYKIVIYPRANPQINYKQNIPTQKVNSLFSISTVCIYCPSSNKITSLPVPTPNTQLSEIFPDFTRNMHNHVVRVSAPTKYLATYEMGFVNGQRRHKRGIHTLMFNTVANKVNLSYTVQPCTKFGNIPEGASGVLLGNGTWAGCMGDVVRGISDMALSVSPDDKRFLAVHFTSPFEYTYVTYTTSKPGLYYSWKIVFSALNKLIWTCIVASILITSVTIHLVDQHLVFGGSLLSNTSIDRFIVTLLCYTGYIVGQPVPMPKSFPSKFPYTFWLFYGLLIGVVYSSSLQSKIVSPGLEYTPKTFLQLVHSSYKWGAASAFRDGLGEQLFKNSKNPVMRSIYHKMDGDKDEVTCTRKALSRYACFNWELMQRFHLVTEFADKSGNHPFEMATDTAFFVSLNFITRKGELYRSHFNNFMSRSFDSGLVKQTLAMDWRKYRADVVEATRQGKMDNLSQQGGEEGPQAFKLDNVKGGFIVLFCGLVPGSVIFLLEKITPAYKLKSEL